MNQTKKKSGRPSEAVWVRCPICRAKLCKRIPMHSEERDFWGIHVQHRKMEILMADTIAVFTCHSCSNKVRINSEKGIEAQWPKK
jgi:hypothetical protein